VTPEPIVAALGWGSLIWRPEALPLRRPWFPDGPVTRIEFLRQSPGGRLTLVVDPAGSPVRTLWALLEVEGVERAREHLRRREGIPEDRPEWVGSWSVGDPAPGRIPALPAWAAARSLDGVVWTGLPPKFNEEEGSVPSLEEALGYLKERRGAEWNSAREYVQRAPLQVNTRYRRAFEEELGWIPADLPQLPARGLLASGGPIRAVDSTSPGPPPPASTARPRGGGGADPEADLQNGNS